MGTLIVDSEQCCRKYQDVPQVSALMEPNSFKAGVPPAVRIWCAESVKDFL